ncbi:MAG: DNA-binding response regulator [Epulopiscium sp. Nele67-Bin004]|nr:MAG: DNA-binding response regulator [Epulopiscium sp. Nele67-Bin004]
MKILLAEDEPDLNNIIAKKLKLEGYTVDTAFDGEQAIEKIDDKPYDVIILDIMMPKFDGFCVLSTIRGNNINTPVIFLSAREHVGDRVRGLDLGASDYIVKPFSFEELIARIRAVLRQSGGKASALITVATIQIDTASRVVRKEDKLVPLSAKEYAILEYLMTNINTPLSREQIQEEIWGDEDHTSNMIDVYIRHLRKKLDPDCEYIQTVRGVGYMMKR